jgi:hypothetical protein
MKPGKIKLPENHRKSLTSAFIMVEQMLSELEDSIVQQHEGCCFAIENDIGAGTAQHNLEVIKEARRQLCALALKYSAGKYNQSLRKIINAKRTRIWEILCDIKSRKQKGFGEFPKELIKEYDSDIDVLLSITEKIEF